MNVASNAVQAHKPRSLFQALKADRGLLVLLLIYVLLLPIISTRIYASDEIKYFSYLPSFYFDFDLKIKNQFEHIVASDPKKFVDFQKGVIDKPAEKLTGQPVNEAPVGSALLWSPAYVVADLGLRGLHALGLAKNTPADGYSKPYVQAVCYASNLLGFLGLLLGYRLCRRYFPLWASLTATLLIWFATPAFFYMYIAPPWSHAASLFAVALFVTVWHDTGLAARTPTLPSPARGGSEREEGEAGNRRRLWQYFALGLLGGLMMTVREQDGLFMLLPAVEGIVLLRLLLLRWQSWRAVGRLVVGNALFLVGVLVGFLPQFYAYHETNGTFGPSKTVAEKFNLLSPHFFQVLLDPGNGMIAWTPVIAFALVGLALLWRSNRLLAAACGLAVLAQVFIAGAFSTWLGAGSFGQRRFVNLSLILILALAALFSYLRGQRVPRWSMIALAVVLVFWNFGLVVNYALWTSEQRQHLDWMRVAHDQFALLNPVYTVQLLWRFVTDRGSFFR